jgi:hypothetical protein
MSIQISLVGLEDVDRELSQVLAQTVTELANQIYIDAKSFTPVRSGHARSSWTKQISKNTFNVENDVPYIEKLDKGSSRQAPKGIIGPTLDKIKGQYK